MKGLETLMMPASLPSGFSGSFANLASFSGALPISHFQIARIGVAKMEPTYPLPPLLAIDGSERPEYAPGLLPEPDLPIMPDGYEADWNVIQDLMDLPPSAAVTPDMDPMDLILARDAGWFDFGSLREIMESSDLPPLAHTFFSNAFSVRADAVLAPSAAIGEQAPQTKMDFLQYAGSRFLEGVLLSRAGRLEDQEKIEACLVQSAMAFAMSDRFSAAAMLLEHAALIQARECRRCVGTRIEQGKMWLAELSRNDDRSFETVYQRALNSAQYDHPGAGLLERIFEAATAFCMESGDRAEAARGFVRTAWARLMKLDAPGAAPSLSPDDWFRTSVDLQSAATFFGHAGLDFHASMAKELSEAASDLEEIARNGTDETIEIVPSSTTGRPDDPTISFRRSRRTGTEGKEGSA
ncbi:MAG: hypothetical protein JXA24_02190 [Proteobacteria bacterium]|nr:hypothetical protein [Pseudomonadota bacterium]